MVLVPVYHLNVTYALSLSTGRSSWVTCELTPKVEVNSTAKRRSVWLHLLRFFDKYPPMGVVCCLLYCLPGSPPLSGIVLCSSENTSRVCPFLDVGRHKPMKQCAAVLREQKNTLFRLFSRVGTGTRGWGPRMCQPLSIHQMALRRGNYSIGSR
jgi:hypothetical protein